MQELWSIYHPDIPPFLQALSETPPMVRLRSVGMNCGCEYTDVPLFRRLRPYSRFDHSMGVGLIVWHFTGSEAQSIAGALHDIATPVFAHTVDFLLGDHLTQEATESRTAELIAASPEIQTILTELGLTTEDVADYHRYPMPTTTLPVWPPTGWNTRWETSITMASAPWKRSVHCMKTCALAPTRTKIPS